MFFVFVNYKPFTSNFIQHSTLISSYSQFKTWITRSLQIRKYILARLWKKKKKSVITMKKFFMVQVREARMCSKINIEFSIDQILVVCLEAH